ncbi:MAG: hypothetical protein H7258_05355 [Ferruginibacter sp.]|nr:hypothetical protein [Ferruginibacter sp.]
MIGEVITQSDLKGMQAMNANNFSQTGYISPTLYRPANGVKAWNIYKNFSDVLSKYKFLNKIPGGKDVKPSGNISVDGPGAVTMGINVDFFTFLPAVGLFPLNYLSVKNLCYGSKPKQYNYIARFNDTKGAGPFYAVIDSRYMAMDATVIKKSDAAKIAALDEYHKQLQLAKANFNAFTAYVQKMPVKNLTAAQQQQYRDAVTMQVKFEQDLRKIKSADIVFGKKNSVSGIGVVPVLVWIVVVVVSAVVAVYSLEKVLSQVKDIKTVNSAYDFQRWSAGQELEIDKAEKAGTITPEQAAKQKEHLQVKVDAAKDILVKASEVKPGIFDSIQNILLIGGGIFLLSKYINSNS